MIEAVLIHQLFYQTQSLECLHIFVIPLPVPGHLCFLSPGSLQGQNTCDSDATSLWKILFAFFQPMTLSCPPEALKNLLLIQCHSIVRRLCVAQCTNAHVFQIACAQIELSAYFCRLHAFYCILGILRLHRFTECVWNMYLMCWNQQNYKN